MHRIALTLALSALLLSACTPPVNVTETAAASTNAAQSSATDAAASQTAAAPTATPSPVPPTATPTEPPGPTPSGVYGFDNVTVEQAGPDTIDVSFAYQLEKGLDLNGVQIMAQAMSQGATCNSGQFSVFSRPYVVKNAPAGIVKGADGVAISMQNPAKCSFKGFTLMVFRVEGSSPVTLYKQDFEIPFDLEKK